MSYDYYQDPSQGYYDMYGMDPYMYQYDEQPQEQEEDTASQKLRKEQEMIEAIESNRLYLRKVRKRCVQEDFADLEKTQMLLFEFLIESLEVNATSELGLIPESSESSELVAKVQFLDTPCLEIREKGERIEGSDSIMGQNEYFETVGNAGLGNAMDPGKTVETDTNSVRGSKGKPDSSSTEMPLIYDTKWENSSGKSILFSKSAIETIQGLDHSPIKIQVCRCATDNEEEKKNICEPLGYAQVRLPDHFSLSVLQSCKSGVILPVSCIHRDSCVLKNVFGVKKGEVQVFVRLSCFGTVITTSFQSVGRDRRYVFKPSPQPGVEMKEDSEINRDNLLKPIVAEEEVAVGITILKDKDIFQKPVVWRNNNQSVEGMDIDFLPKFNQFKDYSLRMPRASDDSLCRNANPPGKKKTFCDWHDLVTKEVKNSLKNNCGCRDGMTFQTFDETCPISAVTKESPHGCSPRERKKLSDNIAKPSLMEKLLGSPRRESFPGVKKVPEVPMKPITGLGISSEPTDCDCDCDRIKNTLAMNPMMKYTWQVK